MTRGGWFPTELLEYVRKRAGHVRISLKLVAEPHSHWELASEHDEVVLVVEAGELLRRVDRLGAVAPNLHPMLHTDAEGYVVSFG